VARIVREIEVNSPRLERRGEFTFSVELQTIKVDYADRKDGKTVESVALTLLCMYGKVCRKRQNID